MNNEIKRFCPLCLGASLDEVPNDKNYLFCPQCYLIHLQPVLRKDPKTEKDRYLKHQNDITNVNYVSFLMQGFEALEPHISEKMKGLDFGCGPNTVLSQLLHQKGYSCDYYDPFFHPNIPGKDYDYILAVECFEHFYYPLKEIKTLNKLLKDAGSICIMTERWTGFKQFNDWYYKRDYTHVCFYHDNTFNFICKTYGFQLIDKDDKRIVVLQKRFIK